MFKPSYLSAQGPYGAYGAGEETPPAGTDEKAKAEEKFDLAKTTCASTFDPETEETQYNLCVLAAKKVYEAALKEINKRLTQKLAEGSDSSGSTTKQPDMFSSYKAKMTPEEYALWLSNIKTACGKAPKILNAKDYTKYLLCAKQQAETILAARNNAPTGTLTKTSLTTEEPNYTWYYVGGAAGVLALGAAAWYFGIYRPKHK